MEQTKYINVADLRSVLDKYNADEIEFDGMVQELNEVIGERVKNINKTFSQLASQAPLWKSDSITKENEESFYCQCNSGNAGFVALDEGRLGCGICGKPF